MSIQHEILEGGDYLAGMEHGRVRFRGKRRFSLARPVLNCFAFPLNGRMDQQSSQRTDDKTAHSSKQRQHKDHCNGSNGRRGLRLDVCEHAHDRSPRQQRGIRCFNDRFSSRRLLRRVLCVFFYRFRCVSLRVGSYCVHGGKRNSCKKRCGNDGDRRGRT